LHALSGAYQQRDAQALLEQAYLLANRARRHPHMLGGGFQGAKTCCFGERAQGKQGQDGAHGLLLCLENLKLYGRTYRFLFQPVVNRITLGSTAKH
jgi:hypothetical protein